MSGVVVVALLACDAVLPNAPSPDVVLDGPLDGLTAQQRAVFFAGDAEFGRTFAVADGLGPIFVASSCSNCHVGDGKGHPSFNLSRFGRMVSGTFDPMRQEGGPQVQNRAILNYLAEVVPPGVTGVS